MPTKYYIKKSYVSKHFNFKKLKKFQTFLLKKKKRIKNFNK